MESFGFYILLFFAAQFFMLQMIDSYAKNRDEED